MIQFDKVEITSDNKLHIKAHVKELSYYENVGIVGAILLNQDTYKDLTRGDLEKVDWNYLYVGNAYMDDEGIGRLESIDDVSYNTFNLSTRGAAVCIKYMDAVISGSDIKKEYKGAFNNDIIYVYLITTGTPSSDTPCGMDNPISTAAVFNQSAIYNIGMDYIRQIEKDCIIPKNFIDFILKYKAVDIALKTGNYGIANQYWNKFFSENKSIPSTTNCGCNE